MVNLTLYTRTNCHLCDEVKADLESLKESHPHRVAEIDVDSDPSLAARYGEAIPVIEVGPYVLRAPISRQDLAMTLGAAADRQRHLKEIDENQYQRNEVRRNTFTGSDKFSYWLSRRYMLLVILSLLLYVGLPVLAPVLMKANATAPANVIYKMYSPLCHQFAFRSFFLFGEQPYYPLRETGITGGENGLVDFETATGITDLHDANGTARLEARAFHGNETVGYKMALCERDIAIYGAMLFFAIIFTLTGRRIKPLHWALWILIGLGPIGLDGFSQIISQFEINALATLLPYRESTPFLRTLTGFLFGFATAWFGIPFIEESMRETRQIFIRKLAIINAKEN